MKTLPEIKLNRLKKLNDHESATASKGRGPKNWHRVPQTAHHIIRLREARSRRYIRTILPQVNVLFSAYAH